MTNRERVNAVLHYLPYDRLPLVHFGYWPETLQKWYADGKLTDTETKSYHEGERPDFTLDKLLGFDLNWNTTLWVSSGLSPGFESVEIERTDDGYVTYMGGDGVTQIRKEGITSVSKEIDWLLKDRRSFEAHFRRRLQYSESRINIGELARLKANDAQRDYPCGIHIGSLYGNIRGWLGLEGLCYLQADDEELYTEIIDVVGDLCYRCAERSLAEYDGFDFAHFWEDICYKNGPLVNPAVFAQKVGPHYKRITELCKQHGIDIVSLDCDGCIDGLVPVWLDNGVNTMFPIEVGTWNASIAPWRRQYGRALRGVGGMDKNVFAGTYADIDREVERLKPLVELGGFIPCPDHRIPPTAVFENVQYYCDRMRRTFQ